MVRHDACQEKIILLCPKSLTVLCCHLQFQSTVETGGAHTFGEATTISDLVTQGTTENIGGAKTFSSVTSSDNVQVTSEINEVPIDRLYSDAVLLDDILSYTVTANWQFSGDVSVAGNLDTTGTIDGML